MWSMAMAITLFAATLFAMPLHAAPLVSANCENIAGKSVWLLGNPDSDEWHADGFSPEKWTFVWRVGQPTAKLVVKEPLNENVTELPVVWSDTERLTLLEIRKFETWLYTIFFKSGRLMVSGHKESWEMIGLAPSKEAAKKMAVDHKPYEMLLSYVMFGTCSISTSDN
jgi:hypothetical protein